MYVAVIFYLRYSVLTDLDNEFEVLDPEFGLMPYGYLIPTSSGSKVLKKLIHEAYLLPSECGGIIPHNMNLNYR